MCFTVLQKQPVNAKFVGNALNVLKHSNLLISLHHRLDETAM